MRKDTRYETRPDIRVDFKYSQDVKPEVYKYDILESIIKNLNMSEPIIKSIFMTTIPIVDETFSILKSSNDDNLYKISSFNKNALKLFVKVVEKIALAKDFDLLNYSYRLFMKLINRILHYMNKDKPFFEVFESNKICLFFFFYLLTSFKHIKSRQKEIQDDIFMIIDNTIFIHENPFYFNLIFALSASNICCDFVIKFMKKILDNDERENFFKYNMANIKNMILLVYRITFVSVENDKEFNDVVFKFFSKLIKMQLIYTKSVFQTFFNKKFNTNDENKERFSKFIIT
jgi:hypothetical protein